MFTLRSFFLYLFLYSFLGFVCETIYCSIAQKKLVNRGFLTGPICPIYGIGALFIVLFLTPLIKSPILVFLMGILLTSTLEYITSFLMEVLFHARWWDYSSHRFNLHGRVCLLNSTLFGIMALFVLYVLHPFVQTGMDRIPEMIQLLLSCILGAIFIADLWITVKTALKLDIQQHKLEELALEIHANLENIRGSSNEALKNRLEHYLQSKTDLSSLKDDLSAAIAAFRTMAAKAEENAFFTRRLKKAFPQMHYQPSALLTQVKEVLAKHRND